MYMSTIKCDKKYIAFICILELFTGIYISSVRLVNTGTLNLHNAFLIAKETDHVDLTSYFDMQIFVSLLNMIIITPLISNIFTRRYNAKIYFAATRMKTYSRFYFRETWNLFKQTVIGNFLFFSGIVVYCVYKIKDFTVDKELIRYFVLSVIHATFILFIFVLVETVISVLLNDKLAMLFTVTLLSLSVLMLFVLPVEMRQYNIISWYFLSEFLFNGDLFTHSFAFYYVCFMVFVIMAQLFLLPLLKKRDTL